MPTDRHFCKKQHRHTRDLVQSKRQIVYAKCEASSEDSSVIYEKINVLRIHKTIIEIISGSFSNVLF
jgi:hypothetical protein